MKYIVTLNYSNWPVGIAWPERRVFDTKEEREKWIEWKLKHYYVTNLRQSEEAAP